MYVAYLKQKIVAIQIWRPVLCLLVIVSMASLRMNIFVERSLLDISYFEAAIDIISGSRIILSLLIIFFFMADVYPGSKNSFDDQVAIRMKSRLNLVLADALYIIVLSFFIMILLLISLWISYIATYQFHENMFNATEFHTAKSFITLVTGEANLRMMNLNPGKAFLTQAALFFLFLVTAGSAIYMINLFLKRKPLGFLVYLLYYILQACFYYVFGIKHSTGIFPYEHSGLFFSEAVNFEVLFGIYNEHSIADRLPYHLSYLYFIILFLLSIVICVIFVGRKDMMIQEGIR